MKLSLSLALLFAVAATSVTAHASAAQDDNMGRRGLKAYSGTSSGGWGDVTTTDNKNGTSTTCTNTPYYKGCTTYANGDGKRRSLKAYEGTSSGSWGSVTTKDNHDGTSTTCTNTPYYSGCTSYPNGEGAGRRLQQADRKLNQYEGESSGAWGSVTTTDNGDGTSTTTSNTPYYQGSTTYQNEAGRR